MGLYTGLGIRNVGLIMEDYFQNVGYDVDPFHPDYNKNTKIKHRSYALGFPIALKVGAFENNFFAYGDPFAEHGRMKYTSEAHTGNHSFS